jgi:hypothetical protein
MHNVSEKTRRGEEEEEVPVSPSEWTRNWARGGRGGRVLILVSSEDDENECGSLDEAKLSKASHKVCVVQRPGVERKETSRNFKFHPIKVEAGNFGHFLTPVTDPTIYQCHCRFSTWFLFIYHAHAKSSQLDRRG